MRDREDDPGAPAHPTLAAALLMGGIVVLLVLLALVGAR